MTDNCMQLNPLQLKIMLRGYVEVYLRTSRYHIVAAEYFGTHWRAKIRYELPGEEGVRRYHVFAIDNYGRLVWNKDC